jgi:acyl dehydratase
MKEMHLSDMKKGMTFPEYRYTLRADIIKTYLEAAEEDPLYTDEAYAIQGPFGQRVVPPTTIAIYVTPSRVFKTIKKNPPEDDSGRSKI